MDDGPFAIMCWPSDAFLNHRCKMHLLRWDGTTGYDTIRPKRPRHGTTAEQGCDTRWQWSPPAWSATASHWVIVAAANGWCPLGRECGWWVVYSEASPPCARLCYLLGHQSPTHHTYTPNVCVDALLTGLHRKTKSQCNQMGSVSCRLGWYHTPCIRFYVSSLPLK